MAENLREDYDFEASLDELEAPERFLGPDQFKTAYARVLVKLPGHIRDLALGRCLVVGLTHEMHGMTWPLSMIDKRQRRWLIVVWGEEDSEIEDRIAHEIAHAWRGDDRHEPQREKATDDLAVAWGFQRSSYQALG